MKKHDNQRYIYIYYNFVDLILYKLLAICFGVWCEKYKNGMLSNKSQKVGKSLENNFHIKQERPRAAI